MPLFISFEGPDGSGKSTQARLLAAALMQRGFAVCETREPGGTAIGEKIRELLLAPDSPPATPLTMALLLSASRSQLVADVIRPALQSGQIVVADRFADSTLAYQAFGLGLHASVVEELTAIATGGTQPDVSIYVDIEPAAGLERVSMRGSRNRMDAQTLQFHRHVREGYLEIITQAPQRWICVDGAAPVEAVHDAIVRRLEPVLSNVGDPA